MDILKTVYHYISFCPDPRLRNWFLFNSVLPIAFTLFGYFYFIFVCGPKFMKNRKPYSLKTFIRCYDVTQILLNSFIIYKFVNGGWYSRIWIYCVPVVYETSPENMELLDGCWWTLVSKYLDLLETIIFVLRKKNNQISFLHVYHHATTLIFGWVFGKMFAGGMAVFVPLLNCSVHVLMYTYYFLSSCGPRIKAAINDYKHFITIIQMTQFIILIAHHTQVFLPSCNVPSLPAALFIANYIMNFFLFYNFYQKSYSNKRNIKEN
ncbi:hypothetical protein M0802_009780 [Mischocyttarus mexicanus]|nr:hypothetical protein M0802_009780 [Mischocyttarus mexicanus]